MNIYLIRHGESESDIKQKYDGDYDDPLTPTGLQQAKEVAKNSLLQNIDAIYSSPKIRAQETAKIIQIEHNVPLHTLENLAEQDIYGAFLELGKDQPEEEYRKLGEVLVNKDTAYDGAETYQVFKDRILDVLKDLTSSPYNDIAVITHGGPIRCVFREIIKHTSIDSLGNGAIIKLSINEDNITVENLVNAQISA